VNWKPIRASSRLEGSVWKQVHASIEQEGVTPLPDSILNNAFMRRVGVSPKARSSRTSKSSVVRLLPQQKALTVDILHAQLGRQGISSPWQLIWVVGQPRRFQRVPREESEEIPEHVLSTLLDLLYAGSGEEGQLCGTSVHLGDDAGAAASTAASLAPSEGFLRNLFAQVGPADMIIPRVDAALKVARFGIEASALEEELRLGIDAVRAVLTSAAVPVLLQGVLLLGNYVNSSSPSLGGASGVSLESLAKLAHTRCRRQEQDKEAQRGQQETREGGAGGSNGGGGRGGQPENALHLVVAHLEQTQPSFMETLSRDLDGCRAARDLDQKAIADAVHELAAQVRMIAELADGQGTERVDALAPERLGRFLAEAGPRVELLQCLLQDLVGSTGALCRFFAEPADTKLADMLRNLAALREALPAVRPTIMLPLPQRAHRRRARSSSVRRPAQALASPCESLGPSAASHTNDATVIESISGPSGCLEEAPSRVIAQVLSLSEGTVRLSWVFDWNILPKELASCEWAAKGFEIVRRREPTSEMAIKCDTNDDVARSSCSRPPVNMELLAGYRYTFEVRAVLTDSRSNDIASSTLCLPPVWASLASPPVSADLRDSSCGADRSSHNVSTNFGVAALLRALNAVEMPWNLPSLSAATSGSGSAPTVAQPLASDRPRVVATAPLDPVLEKRRLSERLVIRSGCPLVTLVEASAANANPGENSDTDSDDGALRRLSSALRCFEKVSQEQPPKSVPPKDNVDFAPEVDDLAFTFKHVNNVAEVPRVEPSRFCPARPHGCGATEPWAASTWTCRLHVQLAGDKVETLEFDACGNLPRRVAEFVERHGLRRSLFEARLLDRAQLMIQKSERDSSVDIVDLI